MPTWEEREKAKVSIVFDTGGLDGFNKVCLSGAKKAEERDLYAIGTDRDQRNLAQDNLLVSILKEVFAF